jgi:hypothetical protein
MRVVILIIFFITIFTYCEAARGLPMKSLVKNLNNAINRACNKKAYEITNNTEMYNCMMTNNTNDCKYITNYTEFITAKNSCVDEKNSEIGSGIFISFLGWFILMFMFQCHK